jgi:hypothetical protein
MGWIEDNFTNCHFNHSIALIAGTSSSDRKEEASVSALIKKVKKLYTDRSGITPNGYYEI